MAKQSKTSNSWGKVVAAMQKWDAAVSGGPAAAKRTNKRATRKSHLSPLLRAAENGDVRAIEELIRGGANVHEKTSPKMAFYHGADALVLASRHGHLDAVRLLLRYGADFAVEAGYGSALEEAIAKGHAPVAKVLIEKGARNFGYSLFSAIAGGHLGVFQELARLGIPFASFRSRNGDSLLEDAIHSKQDEIVRFLLKAGVKPTDGGPLVESVARGDVELTRSLLNLGADPNQINRLRRFPLGMACSRGHKQIAEILLDHGADPTLIDVRGWSCVDWAKHGRHEELVSWLNSLAKRHRRRRKRFHGKREV